MLKAKAIAEEFIRRSGIDYTIFRTAILYGPDDSFTTGLARILRMLPFAFVVPGDGAVQLQPLWIEDLIACLAWSIDDLETHNRMFEIGGPEYLSFEQISQLVMQATRQKRTPLHISPPYLRWMTVLLESFFPALPVSVYWLDYLAVNRTTSLDTLPRTFNLMPSRMSQRLDYLQDRNWREKSARRPNKGGE